MVRLIRAALRMFPTNSLIVAGLIGMLLLLVPSFASAQTYTVLHNFSGVSDGANPWGGLTMDAAGNLYGSASYGGSSTNCQGGCGTVFKLAKRGSNWTFSTLYNFTSADGAYPEGRLIFGPDGRLYGTTGRGGNQGSSCSASGCGVMFAMRPPATFCRSTICYWSEQVEYYFTGETEGSRPTGDIAFDAAGNLYGVTDQTGTFAHGAVYELSPASGGWTVTPLFDFNGSDGADPYGGIALDSSGNLYGTTQAGGSLNLGVVFELTKTGSNWAEQTLHSFDGSDGQRPLGGLILDASGNVYSTTNRGGPAGVGGQVFQLSQSGGNWTIALLHSFSGTSGPWGDLIMDSSGNIYGTTVQDGANDFGSIFKLTFSDGSWTYTSLHDFTGQDGGLPHGSIVLDANGNLYGITTAGGPHNQGVLWEVSP